MGIEPTAQAWEAWVLPLYDARASRILTVFDGKLQRAWHIAKAAMRLLSATNQAFGDLARPEESQLK